MTAPTMTAEQQRIAELEARIAALTAPKALTYKVSEKGAVSVYGMGRFPVTLYGDQWTRLFAESAKIAAFIVENKDRLSRKE